MQRATEEQIRQAEAQQQDDQESQAIGSFVYEEPGNTPQQTFFQKFGSKKRTRTMPASFNLGQPAPGSGHKSEADLRENQEVTLQPFNNGRYEARSPEDAIIEEADEYSDAQGH